MQSSRIRHALYLPGWLFESGDHERLELNAHRVTPTEYVPQMEGHLFCPLCHTNVVRTPKVKELFSNGRRACFAHLSRFRGTECDLRSIRPEGKRFDTEEEAARAIEDRKLVIVHAFLDETPDLKGQKAGEYRQTRVEDVNGPVSEVAIARHRGEVFRLPSKILTVASICRSFDQNLYRYYLLPGRRLPVLLSECLVNVEEVDEEDACPRLYFGVVTSSTNAGHHSYNTRMTKLRSSGRIADFYLKAPDGQQREHGIDDETKDRVVLVWSTIVANGVGLAFSKPGWGAYSLLPTKYVSLLPSRR